MRTVLVPTPRVAHALSLKILKMRCLVGLAGTRFLPVPDAATEVLRAAGTVFSPGEEALRPARLAALFSRELRLEHFSPRLLRSGGWEEAFARTLLELEAQAISPQDLLRHGGPRERDVAAIWSALDRSAGSSLTAPRTIALAAAALGASRARWPFEGPVLAVVTGDLTVAERNFLFALPRLTLGVLAARPRSAAYLARMDALLGPDVARALEEATPPPVPPAPTELDVLRSVLFETPEKLAREDRPQSRGFDGSVQLERYAETAEEIQAAANWIAAELAVGTPLDHIAMIVPSLDPWTALLDEQLARLGQPPGAPRMPTHPGVPRPQTPGARGRGVPIHVPGGLPLVRAAAGPRSAQVICALQEQPLSMERVAQVLPASVARRCREGAPLRQIWPALRTALADHLSAPALETLHDEMTRICQISAVGALYGQRALDVLALIFRTTRVPTGPLAGPAVFVGTLEQARGLTFDATRVVGLTEGRLPSSPPEDIVLPGREPATDSALAQMHDLDRVVRDTMRTLALSTANTDFDGSPCRPSPVLIEVTTALGRGFDSAAPRGSSPPAVPSPPPEPTGRPGRFGEIFDQTVRRALTLLLREDVDTPRAAVRAAAIETLLPTRRSAAIRDVARTRAALRVEGLLGRPGVELHCDYPIAAEGPAGALLYDVIDLLAATEQRLDLITIVTSAPPADEYEASPYIRRVEHYAWLVRAAQLAQGRRIRCGILFTVDARLWWL